MNSEQLKKQFPEVYKDIFSKCTIVCSAPAAFFWCGEWSVAWGGLAIKQALPLRIYLGLELTNQPGVHLMPRLNYDPLSGKFITKDVPSDRLSNFWKAIKPLVDQFIDTNKMGLNVYRLAEFVTSAGLNASGAYCSSLALALYLLTNKITFQKVAEWKNYSPQELNIKKELKFDEIFRLGWKMENFLHYGISSGAGVYSSMLGKVDPIIYCREEKESDSETSNNIDKTVYCADTVANILQLKEPLVWPISFGLIYSGTRVSARVAIKSGQESKEKIFKLCTWGQKKFFNLLPENFLNSLQSICSETEMQKKNTWENYLNILNLNNLEIVKLFKNIFTSAQPDDIKLLLTNISNCQNLLHLLDISTPEIDAICQFLQIKSFENSFSIGTKLTGAGKGGHILVAFPTQKEEKMVHNYFPEALKHFKMKTAYLSWIDGVSEGGIKVEQDLRNNLISDFLASGSIILKIWENGKMQENCLSRDEFEKEKNRFDLILDEETNRLMIKGKKVTSRDFHSQKTTIEILKILLENLDKEVESKRLPSSSYSADRNEMQSKIISPLKQTLKKISQKNLPLEISGGLGRNYFLKLSLGRFKIGLVKRRF